MSAAGRLVAIVVGAVAVAGGAGGCHHHVDGTIHWDAALEAWAADGFETEAVEPLGTPVMGAGSCARGTLSGLEIVLCEYGADDVLGKGEQQLHEAWAADTIKTGTAVRNGRTLLAITDRTNADPSGRTTARLVRMFRGLK